MNAPRGRSIVVIGAGPAGATAAVLLARGGIQVTIIEQSRFPRDKVCGECLSGLSIETIRAAGLGEVVEALSPQMLTRARLVAPGGGELDVSLPAPMWGVTRSALDGALLEAARAAGANVIQPARAEQLLPGTSATKPAVIVRDLLSNTVRRLQADLVLVADGKSALLGAKPRATGELGVKAHFAFSGAATPTDIQNPGATDSICLFGVRGHYVGLAPVSGGDRTFWNLACTVPVQRVRSFGGDHEALLQAMRRENAALDRALAGATRIGPWLACPLPRFAVRSNWPPGVIPLGNAAAALEPVGGEGMGLAIASAALAARFVHEGRITAADLRELRRRYSDLWRWRRFVWRALAMILSRPRLARIGIGAARIAPCSVTAILSLIKADSHSVAKAGSQRGPGPARFGSPDLGGVALSNSFAPDVRRGIVIP